MEEKSTVDWSQWSRDAVAAISTLNEKWRNRYQLKDAKYFWDLDKCQLVFTTSERIVTTEICVVGTASESHDTFLWSWANDNLSCNVTKPLEIVRQFGKEHDLWLLTTDELSGGVSQGKECLAIATRILGAEGAFIDCTGDLTLFFTLSNFQDTSSGAIV